MLESNKLNVKSDYDNSIDTYPHILIYIKMIIHNSIDMKYI